MMYSPLQEVPSTPSLSMYTAHTLLYNPNTPEAVVPDVINDGANSPEQSWSVPGTPVSSALTLSPWTPNARSLTRTKTQQGRRYIYNPSLISSLFRNSPAGSRTLKEQVVPSTPVGGFLLPSTPTRTPRRTATPRRQCHALSNNSTEIQSPIINNNEDTVDAAGDRPRKRVKIENNLETCANTTPKSRPRGERREAVASFRRSPDTGRSNSGDSSTTNDFLDLI